MEISDICIDKTLNEPIYQQLYAQLRDAILTGQLIRAEKLPSIRTLASELGVARNTVENAYNQLQVEGYVASRQGSGYIVQPIAQDALLTALCDATATTLGSRPQDAEFAYDFRYGSLAAGSFPAEEWRKLMGEVLSAGGAALSAYTDERGQLGLRQQIAAYLAKERGIHTDPDQIVITSGTQQSVIILLHLFNPHTDKVAMENPGYPGARAIFQYSGFSIEPVRSDCDAQTYLEDVESSGATLVYTTPAHQFPVGTCMDMNTRLHLLAYAASNDAYIVEDNYDSEFRYNSQPVPSLRSIDTGGRVIYLGTFSKALSPALRMSYMVLPPQLMRRYNEQLGGYRVTVPVLEQETMRLYMERGLWKRHLHRALIANRKLHELLLETIEATFDEGQVEVLAGDAGLFIMLKVKNGMTQTQLIDSAAKAGVGLNPNTMYWLDANSAPQSLVLVGFTAATPEAIQKGIPACKEAWF